MNNLDKRLRGLREQFALDEFEILVDDVGTVLEGTRLITLFFVRVSTREFVWTQKGTRTSVWRM